MYLSKSCFETITYPSNEITTNEQISYLFSYNERRTLEKGISIITKIEKVKNPSLSPAETATIKEIKKMLEFMLLNGVPIEWDENSELLSARLKRLLKEEDKTFRMK